MDYGKIANGIYFSDSAPMIEVQNEAKLANLAGAQPGTIAHTAGYKKIWQLDTDGTTWVEMPGIE